MRIQHFISKSDRPREYEHFYAVLDKTVNEADVREASHFPVPGFPYLRANRFLVGLKEKTVDETQKELWVRWMQRSDLEARKKEIQNLPESSITSLADKLREITDRESLLDKLSFYSETMLEHDTMQNSFHEAVVSAVNDPGEYSLLMRTVGLYPIFSLPVLYVTNRRYNSFRELHKMPLDQLDVQGKIEIYAPSKKINSSADRIAEMLSPSRINALGVPQLTEDEIKELVYAFAPIFSQDVVADYDRPGHVMWKDNQVAVNLQKPTVYYYISYGFIKGEPAIQINYVTWYSGRRGPNTPFIERGDLDSITVRVTLDTHGRPIMVDIMNSCGCYHFFVPKKEKIERVIPNPLGLDPLVPAWLPTDYPEKRLAIRINSGWHQIQHINSHEIPSDATTYQLAPYDILEKLPHADGHTESVFTSKGIMKNSERIEPLFLFSMGIEYVGYMRQRGNHPIKLLGRAHFTDPDLFDQNFIFK